MNRQLQTTRKVKWPVVPLLCAAALWNLSAYANAGWRQTQPAAPEEAVGSPVNAGAESPESTTPASVDAPPENELATGSFDYIPVGPLPEWIAEYASVDEAATSSATAVPRRLLVKSDMWHSEPYAQQQLWKNAREAVVKFLDRTVAPGAGELVAPDRAEIERELVRRKHTHVFRTPVPEGYTEFLRSTRSDAGDLDIRYLDHYCSWVELEFSDEFREHAALAYRDHVVRSRLWQAAIVGIPALALLGVLAGYLNLNHRTRGYYARRLQTLALIASILIVATALVLSTSFAWL